MLRHSNAVFMILFMILFALSRPLYLSMSESQYLPNDSDRYAAEMFDAQRAEILAYFLVGVCDEVADRVRVWSYVKNHSSMDAV